MNRSKLMNHISHLDEEIKVLEERKDVNHIIEFLKSRLEECKAELDKDRHEEE